MDSEDSRPPPSRINLDDNIESENPLQWFHDLARSEGWKSTLQEDENLELHYPMASGDKLKIFMVWDDQIETVSITAHPKVDLRDKSYDISKMLNRVNLSSRFGAFCQMPGGWIILRHTVLYHGVDYYDTAFFDGLLQAIEEEVTRFTPLFNLALAREDEIANEMIDQVIQSPQGEA